MITADNHRKNFLSKFDTKNTASLTHIATLLKIF